MMNNVNLNRQIMPVRTNPSVNRSINNKQNTVNSFDSVLEQELVKNSPLKFSKHAQERLQSRKINFTKNELDKIDNAVNKAAEKGIKDALILIGSTALIANVKSKTVITAASGDNLKENVFTNIDGAVLI